MIASLRGVVSSLSPTGMAVIDVQGVGYEALCSGSCARSLQVGEEAQIVVYTDLTKEGAIRLFGFADTLEKRVFLLLTSVKGVGAKSASDILSRIDKRELLRVIGSGDVTALKDVRGIGKKTAERILVELKDKVSELISGALSDRIEVEQGSDAPREDALAVLRALGFSEREARESLDQALRADPGATGLDSGDLVKRALQYV